ncbi:MAG: AAA family ATPase [Nitrospira sp.]|nr:AAA family ATPase [Nitrospira sp.]
MRIDKIIVDNFKLFEHEEFEFHDSFNLIVGINGSGKTALLRAVAVAMAGWAHAFIKNPQNLRPISDSEIREIQLDKRFDRTGSVSISATGKAAIIDRFGNKKTGHVEWKRNRDNEPNGPTHVSGTIRHDSNRREYNLNFHILGNDILQFIENDGKFELPILAFYECDRLWLPNDKISAEKSATTKFSRFDPYKDCFHTGIDHSAIGEWLLKHELASVQQGTETTALKIMRQAAIAALEDCTGLRFDFEEGRVIVEFAENKAIPFEHLSDGQRTMLALFCDIARRAILLNPHLETNAARAAAGIVLIDELDLHLHPRWQRRVVHDLRRAFPNIQFICTTHSPQIIGEVPPEQIIVLKDGERMQTPQSYGMDSNWILDTLMEADSRNPEVTNELGEIFHLIETEEYDHAETRITDIRNKLGGDTPELVEAMTLIEHYRMMGDEQ